MGDVGQEIYNDSFLPIADPYDTTYGNSLRVYIGGLGIMLQPVEDIVRDPDRLLDPDDTPASWLPWLGQFVDVVIRPSLGFDEAIVRETIKNPPRARRGSVPAILDEVSKLLTGTKTIVYYERGVGGDAWHGSIATRTSETPDPAAVVAIVAAIKPAGELINVTTYAGGDWATLAATHATWTEVVSDRATWQDVLNDPSVT